MSFSWRSADEYKSTLYPAVKYRISKMSMGRRIELTKRVKDLMKQIEFASAGVGAADKVDAAILAGQMDKLYWEFGLESIDGLEINGEQVTPAEQFERGPEDLSKEILQRIKANCCVSEDERKN